MERAISLLGLAAIVFATWLMSSHRSRFSWRVVAGGMAMQFFLAWLVLRTTPGQFVFAFAERAFTGLLDCVDEGAIFLFGANFADHYFAFKVLPVIVFFSAFMSIFYYYGVMQKVVELFAWVMQKTLGTSGAETLATVANIFVGLTEAPLVIRPYISAMTLSELNALMVGGFATIAGSVLAAYVGMGISAQHLLCASVISAPAALMIAKIMQPEVDQPLTLGHVRSEFKDPSTNVLEAITNGALSGLKLALNVAAMLLTFLALIAVLNALLGWCGDGFWWLAERVGFAAPENPTIWSLEAILGSLFAPCAWLMGIPWAECRPAGELLGLKIVTNEFLAYERLATWMQPDSSVQLSERTELILTYALCGFANFGSIGIQLGGVGGIAPDRRGDLARLSFRAMIGGTLAAFATACVAGLVVTEI